jgi:hypothetical protein
LQGLFYLWKVQSSSFDRCHTIHRRPRKNNRIFFFDHTEVAKKTNPETGQGKTALVYKISSSAFDNKEMESIGDILMAVESGRINRTVFIEAMKTNILAKKTAEELEKEQARKGLNELNDKTFNESGLWGRFTS